MDDKPMRLSLVAAAITAVALFPPASIACTKAIGPENPMVQRLMNEGAIVTAAPHDNVGLYIWNTELDHPVLVNSWHDPSFESTPIEEEPNDVVESEPPPDLSDPTITLPNYEELGCQRPRALPPVYVSTSRPGGAIATFSFLRMIGFSSGRGPVAVNRPSRRAGVPAPAPCQSDVAVREQAASVAVRNSIPPAMCAANRVSIRQPGYGTVWEVDFPGGRAPGVYRWGTRTGSAECRASTFLIEEKPPQC
jgi:hypothetical protein